MLYSFFLLVTWLTSRAFGFVYVLKSQCILGTCANCSIQFIRMQPGGIHWQTDWVITSLLSITFLSHTSWNAVFPGLDERGSGHGSEGQQCTNAAQGKGIHTAPTCAPASGPPGHRTPGHGCSARQEEAPTLGCDVTAKRYSCQYYLLLG